MPFNLKLVNHTSARSVVISFFRFEHPRISINKLLKLPTQFTHVEPSGKETRAIKVKEFIKVVKEFGVWGFCDSLPYSTNRIIHYWISKNIKNKKTKLLDFLGHELGHAMGYSSESTAQKFGMVSLLTYQLYTQHFSRKKNKKRKINI